MLILRSLIVGLVLCGSASSMAASVPARPDQFVCQYPVEFKGMCDPNMQLRQLMTQSYYWSLKGDVRATVRKAMGTIGLPTNLTDYELELFLDDRSDPLFHRLEDIPWSGYGAKVMKRWLKVHNLYFVVDALKIIDKDPYADKPRDIGPSRLKMLARNVGEYLRLHPTDKIAVSELDLPPDTVAVLREAGYGRFIRRDTPAPAISWMHIARVALALSAHDERRQNNQCHVFFQALY